MLNNTFQFQSNIRSNHFFKKIFGLIVVSLFFITTNVQAQCAMCRASLESEGNTSKLEAVNDGIVYLMVIPYVLVGIVGYLIFRMYTKKKDDIAS